MLRRARTWLILLLLLLAVLLAVRLIIDRPYLAKYIKPKFKSRLQATTSVLPETKAPSSATHPFQTAYSGFELPADDDFEMEVGFRGIVGISSSEYGLGLLPPVALDPSNNWNNASQILETQWSTGLHAKEISDTLQACETGGKDVPALIADTFQGQMIVASLRPLTTWELLSASPQTIRDYLIIAVTKAINSSERGTSWLETDSIKSIVFWGAVDEPNVVHIRLWDAKGTVTQTAVFTWKSGCDPAPAVISTFLLSYRFVTEAQRRADSNDSLNR